MKKLKREFYLRETTIVAKELLGKFLIRESYGSRQVGKIVEVEAYLGAHDLACHASKGITPRTRVMYGQAGHAYVYLIYGIHHCFNVVTEPEGHGAAVLIRALEPIENIAQRTSGPGLLCGAMGIDRALNGYDLLSQDFYIAQGARELFSIVERPRIGVDYAKEWSDYLLRYYIQDNVFVSKK